MFATLFYGIPLAVFVWFGVSLYRYLTVKKESRQSPGCHDDNKIRHAKWMTILSGVIAGVLLTVVIGFFVLIGISIAYM